MKKDLRMCTVPFIVIAKFNCRIDTICVETRNGPSGTRPRELNKTPRLQIKYAFIMIKESAYKGIIKRRQLYIWLDCKIK